MHRLAFGILLVVLSLSVRSEGTGHLLSWHHAGRQGSLEMEESVRLAELVVEKLSTVPDRILGEQSPERRAAAASLLRTLMVEESFGEIRESSGGGYSLALAVRVAPLAAESHLADMLDFVRSLGWEAPRHNRVAAQAEWTAAPHHASPMLIRAAVVGEWLLLAGGEDALCPLPGWQASLAAGQVPSTLPPDGLLRIEGHATRLLEHLSGVHLSLVGESGLLFRSDGESVLTEGSFSLSEPIDLPLPEWKIPHNIIHDPIVSFSGTRGMDRLIQCLPLSETILSRGVPDQWFSWSRTFARSPNTFPIFPLYVAWPVDRVEISIADMTKDLPLVLGESLLTSGRLRLSAHQVRNEVALQMSPPLVQPYLRGVTNGLSGIRVFGLFPLPGQPRPVPEVLLSQLEARENQVIYHWEITQNRIDLVSSLIQTASFLFGKQQMVPGSASLRWLEAVSPRLGENAITLVSAPGSARLELERKSRVGLTGLELVLLARWIESDAFPWIDRNALQDWRLGSKPSRSRGIDAPSGR